MTPTKAQALDHSDFTCELAFDEPTRAIPRLRWLIGECGVLAQDVLNRHGQAHHETLERELAEKEAARFRANATAMREVLERLRAFIASAGEGPTDNGDKVDVITLAKKLVAEYGEYQKRDDANVLALSKELKTTVRSWVGRTFPAAGVPVPDERTFAERAEAWMTGTVAGGPQFDLHSRERVRAFAAHLDTEGE